MPTHPVKKISDDLGTNVTFSTLLAEAGAGGIIKTFNALQAHTERQRDWWKGVLLPALSKKNSETKRQWEIKLIAAVFPKDIYYTSVNNQVFPVAESISNYGKKKMNILIEESVARCHELGFDWVTLPDSSLRSK